MSRYIKSMDAQPLIIPSHSLQMKPTSDQAEYSNAGRLPSRVNRKKDPKTNEDVWPEKLESHLKDALQEYSKKKNKQNTRCIYIRDYLLKKTGETRSTEQIGSRLQQLKKKRKEDGEYTELAKLIRSTQRKPPSRLPYTQVFRYELPNSREGPSYEEMLSPISTNTNLSASPYSESLEALPIQDEWAIRDTPSTATYFNFNDDSLWEQAGPYNDNEGYLQEAATFTQTHPGVGGEPDPDSMFLLEWFNSQYPNPGYQQ